MNTIQTTSANLGLIILYADDIVIIVTGPDLNISMHDIIVEQMNIVTTWVKKQGLNLSIAKTNIVAFHRSQQRISLKHIQLGEEILPIKPFAPYLGVDLDKNLSFKKHIDNKITKTKVAARPLNYLINKNWGLSLEQARYVHNQIIIPNLLYAAGIWGHTVLNNNTSLQKLQTVQNKITRKITGGHEHTQSATLTKLAGVEPLVFLINKERINNYIHLSINNNWGSDPNHGSRAILTHSKDIENYLLHLNPEAGLDLSPTQEIAFYNNENLQTNGQIEIYTDGSKMENPRGQVTGAGAIIIYEQTKKAIIQSLAPINTINQAELQAICMVAENLLSHEIRNKNITIYTDSKTTLTRLTRGYSNSKQLTNTIESLHNLQTHNNIKILKVKAHSNIPGNEAADYIAKRATRDSNSTANPFGLTKSQLMNAVKEDCRVKFINHIEKANYSRWTTTLLYKLIRDFKNLKFTNKPYLRSITLAVSGQNNLNSAISHKDKKESALCKLCKVKENAEHKLIHCPDLEELRFKLDYQDIANNILTPDQTLDLGKLTKLTARSNLFI